VLFDQKGECCGIARKHPLHVKNVVLFFHVVV
jgi:hypothetical protein